MQWFKKLLGVEPTQPSAPAAPDFATATAEELTAYNQALDLEVQSIQARRAEVARIIEKKVN